VPIIMIIMPPPLIGGGKMRCCLTSVAYIGTESRTERPRETKIGTEVAHVTRESDTTFKVKRSKVKVNRLLYTPPCWRVRQLRGGRRNVLAVGKLLLRCRLLGGARRFSAQGGGEGRGHIVARLHLVSSGVFQL